VITVASPTDEPTPASREGGTSPVDNSCRRNRRTSLSFGGRREWVGRLWRRTSASLPFSPRPAGRTCGSHPPGRRSGPTDLGRVRSTSRGRVPLRPCSPRASAKKSSSWPRGRCHASSGLGRPISSAIDRPSLWRSSSRTLRSAFPPRRPPPPALQFFNGFFNGEGTPATGRVADPHVSVVPPRQNDPRRTLVRASLASVPVRPWRPGHPLGLDVRQALMTRTPRPVTHLDPSHTSTRHTPRRLADQRNPPGLAIPAPHSGTQTAAQDLSARNLADAPTKCLARTRARHSPPPLRRPRRRRSRQLPSALGDAEDPSRPPGSDRKGELPAPETGTDVLRAADTRRVGHPECACCAPRSSLEPATTSAARMPPPAGRFLDSTSECRAHRFRGERDGGSSPPSGPSQQGDTPSSPRAPHYDRSSAVVAARGPPGV